MPNHVVATTLCDVEKECFDIEVKALQPQPNYPLTTDHQDKYQLVDNIESTKPIWTRSSSVMWQHQTPIKIEIDVKDVSRLSENNTYSLYFRLGSGSKSGVYYPRYLDVFGESAESINRVGELYLTDIESSYFSDAKWFEVPLSAVEKKIIVFLHSNKTFVSLDEIALAKSTSKMKFSDYASVSSSSNDLRQVSIQALKDKLSNSSFNDYEDDVYKIGQTCMDISPPWDQVNLDNCLGISEKVEASTKNIFAQEGEHLRISVVNNESVDLELHVGSAEGITFETGQIVEVLSADGKVVFDPILPVLNKPIVKANSIAHYLIKFRLGSKCDERCKYNIMLSVKLISSSDKSVVINRFLNYLVLDLGDIDLSSFSPNVITWGYSLDKPIWNNKKLAVEDMLRHGVNVFLVHPDYLPSPYDIQNFTTKKNNRLQEEFALYKDKGMLLLYTGIDGWYRSNQERVPNKKEWSDWINIIKRNLRAVNMQDVPWAVFIIDEPAGKDFNILKDAANKIKLVDNEIKIYANPISNSTKITTIKELTSVIDVIDIWQPSEKFARSNTWKDFSNKVDGFWIYGGPGSPVKSASPRVYRDLSRQAQDLGANGVGFWSYSDTSGSSAWDDFDGRRPDWSVVYEGEASVVSSRRWEAFAKGIEEFKISEYLLSENLFDYVGTNEDILQDMRSERSKIFR